MRRLRISIVALLLASGGVFVTGPAAAAADTAPPTLGDITMSPDTVQVAGLALVPVTVAVPMTDESGVVAGSDGIGAMSPAVSLKQVSGGDDTSGAELALTSGTAQDGVITGAVTPPGASPVQLQELRNTTWRTIGSGRLDDRGRFSFDVRPQRAGTFRYRVVDPDSEDEELTGVSRTVVVTVRAPGGGGDAETLPITGPATPPLRNGAVALIVAGVLLVLAGNWHRLAAGIRSRRRRAIPRP